MDFYKSRNSNSTSSQHSNSNSSFKSHASSNNGASYNLEYCTSSSSLSPFGTRANLSSFNSCPSSSAKTIVNVGLEEVFLSISNNSSSSASHISASSSCSSALALSKFSNNMCSSSRNSTTTSASSSSAARVTAFATTSAGKKRKRCATTTLDDRDPESEFEPLAKRQPHLASVYQSDNSSIVSSAYPSPVDEILAQELDTHSSSECLSTGANFDLVNDAIPDSPNSLAVDEADVVDLPEEGNNDDDDADDQQHQIIDLVYNGDDDNKDSTDPITDDDDIISGTTSPYSTTSITQAYNTATTQSSSDEIDDNGVHDGERTPGQRLSSFNAATKNVSNNISASPIARVQVQSFEDYLITHYTDCMTPADDPEPPRQCPLPALSWANAQEVWQLMCKKDEQAHCLKDYEMLDYHPGLQPRMRAILLDWLIEVCEVYKLHRETYYLAVDYLDRYLTVQKNVQKTHLQLIGITCLFVAAKVEEIYPPKIGEFAYVTDGACQDSDILQHEILLLQTLEWSINPVTPIGWLGIYMQLNVNNRTPASFQTSQNLLNKQPPALNNNNPSMRSRYNEVDDSFIYPQFSGLEFVQTAQLLDLCSLDVNANNFSYSVLAAAAISHTFDRATALRCSGFDWQTLQVCYEWMKPYFEVVAHESHHIHLLEQNEQLNTKFGLGHVCPNIVTDDSHIIQTHTTTMAMFDRVILLQEQMLAAANEIKQDASPAIGLMCPHGLLTPPASSRKPMGILDEDDDNDDDDDDNDGNHENLQAAN